LVDAVPRLARVAAHRIEAGALNGHGVADLAGELGVSERHLRRALERELGVSPVELAQTHRLLLAKRLLADTSLPVTRIAFASGFQSLRRFNSVFRERYRMSPSALRRAPRNGSAPGAGPLPAPEQRAAEAPVRLTLAYRAPFDWDLLAATLRREAIPGVEAFRGSRYLRTVRLEGQTGVVVVGNAGIDGRSSRTHLDVDVSPSLLPALMPLLARLRQLFDLDAEPAVVDACLVQGGLARLVRRHPGVRVPGAFDGFEVALRDLVRGSDRAGGRTDETLRRIVAHLGEPLDTGMEGLDRVTPDAVRIADAGASTLAGLGLPLRRAESIAALAAEVAGGSLRLEPGSDVEATKRALMHITGVGDRLATMIVMRALYWPDAFPASDAALQRAAGVSSAAELRDRAEAWRPWRAYAAMHFWLVDSIAGR
jgi:AraC family transcriptional regulator of adaptative response / DNA-3-methyladenine glycosylase II